MLFTFSLYLCLVVFGLGFLFKAFNWFRIKIGPQARDIPVSARIGAAASGCISTAFSKKVFILLRVFIVDVLFQGWMLKRSFLRWTAHMCIWGGFAFLLVMHGLEQLVTTALFPGYASTLNPFMFLRDLAAALVLLGIALVLYRRLLMKGSRPKSTTRDYYAITVLAVIMVSGIVLEGTQITSHAIFRDMVDQYAGIDPEEDASQLKALESYWVEAFGVVSPDVRGPMDAQTLAQGKEIHIASCADCHSRPQSAFLGYGVAGALRPFALSLDRTEFSRFLWYVHFLTCFLGLALLPFSKFFHVVATPLNLLVNAVMDEKKTRRANIATKRALELDACTHCGECTARCSVAIAYRQIPNPAILPSEKLAALRKMGSRKKIEDRQLRVLQQGNHICTGCHRCTDVCPVGINLEALWLGMGDDLARLGYPRLEIWARNSMGAMFKTAAQESRPLLVAPLDGNVSEGYGSQPHAQSFSVCFGCQTCTNVCPVVAVFDNPGEEIGLLPHQIMHALALGRTDLAVGSGMLWDCVTCYLCQEECPQGVCVTDVLYALKNVACKKAAGTENAATQHEIGGHPG
jgi:heterodisulfide reductase subunit C